LRSRLSSVVCCCCFGFSSCSSNCKQALRSARFAKLAAEACKPVCQP
jgi:hypothetical protein